MNLKGIYRTFYPTAEEYTYFSSTHRTFFKAYHILEYKTSINKLRKIEIISSIVYNHNGIKLETNNRGNQKIHKYVEVNQHTPKQPMGQ